MNDNLAEVLDDLTVVVDAAHSHFKETFLQDYQRLDPRNATESLVARLRTIDPALSHKVTDDFYPDAMRAAGYLWRFFGLQAMVILLFGVCVYFNFPTWSAAVPLLLAVVIGGLYLVPQSSLIRLVRHELAADHLRQAYNILKSK